MRRARELMRAWRLGLALAGCLLLTACPPEGGRLAPQPGGEAAARVTSRKDGEALQVARAGVTMAAGGRWSVADAATSVILDISNANAEELRIDFGRAELLAGEGREPLSLRSVSDENAPGGPAVFLRERVVTVGGGRSQRLALEFKLDAGGGRAGVRRDVSGQAVVLRIPVEVMSATPAQVDFVFDFKYEDERRRP